jgi:hypothetical protein
MENWESGIENKTATLGNPRQFPLPINSLYFKHPHPLGKMQVWQLALGKKLATHGVFPPRLPPRKTLQLMFRSFTLIVVAGFLLAGHALFAAEDRDAKVLQDRQEVQASGTWVYNDLARGMAAARRTGRPLLVVFRCVP